MIFNSLYFTESSPGARGAISHIVYHSSNYPTFKKNEIVKNPDPDYNFDPRRTYKDHSFVTTFVSLNNEKPYLIYDLHPYSILPFSYSISLMEDYTPPVEWTISVSNTGNANDWLVISHPPKNMSVCPNSSLTSTPCTQSVTNSYSTNNSLIKGSSYRYINFTVIKDRYCDIFPYWSMTDFRIQRIDFYGYLLGFIRCYASKFYAKGSSLWLIFNSIVLTR